MAGGGAGNRGLHQVIMIPGTGTQGGQGAGSVNVISVM